HHCLQHFKATMSNLFLWLLCLCSLILGHGVLELEASHHVFVHLQSLSSAATSPNQPYRTAYHFQPPKNWINGPLIYKGIYHLFYQYNPLGAVWGNIVWAHSTSTDLVNWTPHDPAIYPSQPSDINGTWSGSTTILPNGKPVILYTGINPMNQQVQNQAVPKNLSDPFLLEWVKSPYNPLMAPNPMNMINASSFRDPTTAWLGPDRRWRTIIGSKRNRRGMAILYRSRDFIHWIEAKHPLHSSKDTGMWECPDFYPVSTGTQNGLDTSTIGLGVKHVIKVSLDDTKHDYYTIGTYNHVKDIYTPDKGSVDNDSGLRYDSGKYYASKTFFDSAKDRRILLGWINESTNATIDTMKGWSGIHAIPRKIWLHKLGKQLVQWPVVEIEKLRSDQVDLPSTLLKGGSVVEVSGVTATQADVDVTFDIKNFEKADVLDPSWTNPQALCSRKGASVKGGLGPFGSSLHLDYDKTTYGAFVDVDPVHEKLSLRSLIDHSIVESFGGEGKACISARVYPTLTLDKGAHLYAFNNGTEGVRISQLSAWSMKKAHIN
ncbi:hypothetical protein RJ640_008476, partial [Escallonia rubra]